MMLTERYPLIYCALCQGNFPVRLDVMLAGRINDHNAVDLMCSNCDLVIATLHEDTNGRADRD